MEESKIPQRLIRVARDISRLPPELHEPILSELQFEDIIRIALAPSTSTALTDSIRFSDEWKWLFYDRLPSIKASWAALDNICWLWCQRTWSGLWKGRPLYSPFLWYSSRDKERSVFSFCSQELRDKYSTTWHTCWDSDEEDYKDTLLAAAERAQNLADLIDADLRVLVVRLCGMFMGTVEKMPKWRHGDYFSLQLWRKHRSLGVAERRAVALFLPGEVRMAFVKGDPLPREWKDGGKWQQKMERAPTEEMLTQCAERLGTRILEYDEVLFMLPLLRQALTMINEAQAAELDAMGDLLKRFSDMLKDPRGPNMPRNNVHHALGKLRRDAERARRRPAFTPHHTRVQPNPHGVAGTMMMGNYRFRHPHLVMIPYNWCLHLFAAITQCHPVEGTADGKPVYPPTLRDKLKVALVGFEYMHGHGDQEDTERRRRISLAVRDDPYYLLHLDSTYGCPKPLAEMRWLEAFLECVDWMRGAFPQEYTLAKRACDCSEPAANVIRYKHAVMSSEDYEKVVQTTSLKEIARHLLLDADVCNNKGGKHAGLLPSLLALHVPSFDSPQGKAIALHLLKGVGGVGVDVGRLVYENMVSKITYCIQYPRLGERTESIYRRWIAKPGTGEAMEATGGGDVEGAAKMSADADREALQAGLRIAERLKGLSSDPTDIETADTALAVLQKLLHLQISRNATVRAETQTWDALEQDYHNALASTVTSQQRSGPPHVITRCYICRFIFTQPHPVLPSMCIPCGDFNLAGSRFTGSPAILEPTRRKIALVTGGRVNLGFHLALRLLRIGCYVIVTTRYPRDALTRYQEFFESQGREYARTMGRLAIVGADFRTSVDVFATARQVKEIVDGWTGYYYPPSLYMLINNAAQTLTDSVAKEEICVQREALLHDMEDHRCLRGGIEYQARVRGGATAALEVPAEAQQLMICPPSSLAQVAPAAISNYTGPSSWMQRLADIPYTDFISAHSVNTFAPLILIRELAPLMTTGEPGLQGHIVNVSSREGIFEARRGNTAKRGRHVHTNMSKAGLNMITETEAETMWKERKIAMNTVDPGYMSAAPECEGLFGGERPISWEDGAGRVLWPIYRMEEKWKEAHREGAGSEGGDGIRKKKKGEREYEKYWGRFFKHYGATRVEPRFGRG